MLQSGSGFSISVDAYLNFQRPILIYGAEFDISQYVTILSVLIHVLILLFKFVIRRLKFVPQCQKISGEWYIYFWFFFFHIIT